MRTRLWAAAAAAGVLLVVGAASPANALFGNPDGLPAGSTACSDWVQSSQGIYLRGYADYNPARFTTRVSSVLGGPETTIFSATTRVASEYGLLVTPSTPGNYYFRSCVDATQGPVYRFSLRITGADRTGTADLGPHQATLGPGGRWCGDFVEGPSVGRDDGVARLTGTSTVPVRFGLFGSDADYAGMGQIFAVTGTAVDEVYVPAPEVSELFVCATNTSDRFATLAFELTAV